MSTDSLNWMFISYNARPLAVDNVYKLPSGDSNVTSSILYSLQNQVNTVIQFH